MRVRHSHLNHLIIVRIMKKKTTLELQSMPLNELRAYTEKRKQHAAKWEKIQLFVMGFCLGGVICTVLMYAVHVGF